MENINEILRHYLRRWLDSGLRDEVALSRLDKDRTDGLITETKKMPSPPQNVLGLGEELQYWTEKVVKESALIC